MATTLLHATLLPVTHLAILVTVLPSVMHWNVSQPSKHSNLSMHSLHNRKAFQVSLPSTLHCLSSDQEVPPLLRIHVPIQVQANDPALLNSTAWLISNTLLPIPQSGRTSIKVISITKVQALLHPSPNRSSLARSPRLPSLMAPCLQRYSNSQCRLVQLPRDLIVRHTSRLSPRNITNLSPRLISGLLHPRHSQNASGIATILLFGKALAQKL